MTAIEDVINRFCSAYPTRPALQKPICHDGRIVATDGRIAILCRRAFAEDLYARLEIIINEFYLFVHNINI